MRERSKDLTGFANLPGLIVLLLIAVYSITFSAISIRQHDAFLTHKEDFGQIDQAVWNSLHGRWLVETDEDHQSTRLTDHAEPILILSSLVFLIWDDARALLVLQAVVAALGAWAIFLLARDVFSDDRRPPTADYRSPSAVGGHWLAIAFALVYLLFPALEAAHLAEFHAAPLAAAPIAFALLFLERRQWRAFVVASLLVVAVKEEMALVGVMLGAAGLLVAWGDERRPTADGKPRTADSRPFSPRETGWRMAVGVRWPMVVLLISLIWFVVATFIIIPRFGAAKYASGDSVYFQRYGELGATPAAVVHTLLTNPQLVLRVLSQPARLGYLGGLLASVGFLALAAPELLLLAAPLLMANLLSNFPAQYSGDFHYSAPLAPFFVVAAIYGMKRISNFKPFAPRQSRVAPLQGAACGARHTGQTGFQISNLNIAGVFAIGVLLISALAYHRAHGYSPLSENFYWPAITPHQQLFDRFAAQIPHDARVSATPPLFPHLSHREAIYVFPVVADAEYVLLDTSGVTDMHPNDFRNAVIALMNDEPYGILDSADGYILLQRTLRQAQDAAVLPDAFYDFARAPDAQPQVRADIVFGDSLRLIGYDVIADARRHRVVTRYYWQALRPLDNDLRIYPFYHDAQGNIIEDTLQRPMIATVWYPPPRWRPSSGSGGETIRTETLPWDVGDSFALAVGVIRGNDWDRKGRRLATSTGETQIELGQYAWQAKELTRK